MSVTMLPVLFVLSIVGVMAPSMVWHDERGSDSPQRWDSPGPVADCDAQDKAAVPADADQRETRSVLRSRCRIGERPAAQAAPPTQAAPSAPPERGILQSPPLPVAPALQPALTSPALIWPSTRYQSRRAGSALPAEVGISRSSSPSSSSERQQQAATRSGRPQLTLSCQSPVAVDLGAQVRYRLVVQNTGDGVAQQVVVEPQILAGGSRRSPAKCFPVGDLPPGAAREITLRDLARCAESLHVRFFATDVGGCEATAEARVRVRQPAIQVALDGPGQIDLGEQASFEIHAKNAGSGAAEVVSVRCSVGDGLRLTVVDQQVQFAARQGQMTWAIGRLAAGETKVLRFKARPETAGEHLIRVSIEGEANATENRPPRAEAEKMVMVRDRTADQRTASL